MNSDKPTPTANGPLTLANMKRAYAMLLKQADAAKARQTEEMRWLADRIMEQYERKP